MQEINKQTVGGVDVYYNEKSGCPVIDYLKRGILYGTGNAELLESLLIDDGIVLDCGGHIGTFSVPMSKYRHVLCVEGSENNFECLKKTFENSSSVDVVHAILSDSIKKCGFNDNGAFGHSIDGDQYTTSTIDSLCEGLKVAGIKLDIEGGEIEALLGATKTLEESNPPILMEINGWCLYNIKKLPQDLISVVNNLGYNVYLQLGSDLFLVDKNKKFPMCVCDVVCIHKSKVGNYNLANIRSLTDSEIDSIINAMYARSNGDCKVYYDSIRG